jgi:hypothetical protein
VRIRVHWPPTTKKPDKQAIAWLALAAVHATAVAFATASHAACRTVGDFMGHCAGLRYQIPAGRTWATYASRPRR